MGLGYTWMVMLSILKNKIVLAVIAVLLIILATIGFVVFRNRGTAVVVDNTPIELIWWKYGTNSDNNQAYNEIIDSFRKLNGNNNVSIRIVTPRVPDLETYYQNLITDFAKDTGPDMFSVKDDDFAAMREFMTPITNVFGAKDIDLLAEYKTNYVDLAVRNTTYRDQIYGITSHVDNLQLYYNKELLQQADIALPPDTWTRVTQDLTLLNNKTVNQSEFQQHAISLGTGLTEKNGDLQVDKNIANFQDILPMLVFQNGGQLYDFTSENVLFGRAQSGSTANGRNAALSALEFYLSFSDPQNSRYSWTTEAKNNTELFLEGKLAYMLGYRTFEEEIKEKNSRLDFGVAELPQLDRNRKKTYGTFYLDGVSRRLEKQAAVETPEGKTAQRKLQKSREFIYYLSSQDSQSSLAGKTNLPSAHRKVLETQLTADERLRIFASGALYADNYYKPDPERSERMWGDLIYRIQFENNTPEASLDKATQEYGIIVQNGPKLRI